MYDVHNTTDIKFICLVADSNPDLRRESRTLYPVGYCLHIIKIKSHWNVSSKMNSSYILLTDKKKNRMLARRAVVLKIHYLQWPGWLTLYNHDWNVDISWYVHIWALSWDVPPPSLISLLLIGAVRLDILLSIWVSIDSRLSVERTDGPCHTEQTVKLIFFTLGRILRQVFSRLGPH